MDNPDFFLKSQNLKSCICDYEEIKDEIKTGIDSNDLIKKSKKHILKKLNASERDWKDYRWQLKNSFSDVRDFGRILQLMDEDMLGMEKVSEKFRISVSPYYLSLIDEKNQNCPIKKMCIPTVLELDGKGEIDPMDEEGTSLKCGITRRYPDRLIINVTNKCGTFCRHCQRRRLFGQQDTSLSRNELQEAFEYIRQNPEIRDVLITGGDAFLISDEQIEWMLQELRKIRHVEIIRFGTRAPVSLPQRITKDLVKILKKYHPVYINTQFNHPLEITMDSKKACEQLADAGIPVGNQMVLLNKVNNDKFIVRKLNQELLKIRVRPYYIFHPKEVKGTSHFWVPIQEGLNIMESLRGNTSGLAIPCYILNAPKGQGKVPLLPNYILSLNEEKGVFRNWQGEYFTIEFKK